MLIIYRDYFRGVGDHLSLRGLTSNERGEREVTKKSWGQSPQRN